MKKKIALALGCMLLTGLLKAQITNPGGSKLVIDARDIGVDCSYTNDSAPALNALTDNETQLGGPLTGATLQFPPGCHVKLFSSNWKIKNQGALSIKGASRGTPPYANGTIISYCGSSSIVPVIDMEYVYGAELSDFIVEAMGSGCSTMAPIDIVIDKAGSGGRVNTTDIDIHDVTLTTNLQGLGTIPSNWIGLSLSPLSNSNVEDVRLRHSRIYCNRGVHGGANAVGVKLNRSFNAKLEEFNHNQILSCMYGYEQDNGDWMIEGGDFAGNVNDVAVGPGSDPGLIEKVVSESQRAIYATGGGNWPQTLIANHVGWGTNEQAYCGMDFGRWGANGGNYVLIGNGSDPPPHGSGAFPLCASIGQNLTMIGNQWYQGNFYASGETGLPITQGKYNFGSTYSVLNGGRMRMGQGYDFGNENVGYGFYTQYGVDLNGLGFNSNTRQDGNNPGGLNIGHDVMYLGNQNMTFTGMWPIPYGSAGCTYTGSAGSTSWNILILPVDSNGKRGGVDWSAQGGGAACPQGASTLSASNYLTVTWPRVTGAANYYLILMNPSAPASAGERIATVADPGSGTSLTYNVTSGSTHDKFNYVFPAYYESANTAVWGESLTVNAPTTFNSTVALNSRGSANHVVCFKSDGKTLGYCSTQPDSTGSCTCK